MIAYFTGTGNSYQLAKIIADATGDDLMSINDCMRAKNTAAISSEKPLVFVAPIYCGRIPRIVEEHIRETDFTGSSEAYFAVTCSQTTYKARHYIERLCADKGWKLKGFGAVQMPQNYIAMYTLPSPEEAQSIITAAEPKMHAIAEAIRDGKPLGDSLESGGMMSNVINPIFYKTTINAKGFHATDACVGCGTCASACPLGNIRIVEGKPVWGEACTHCMACINICPHVAIEFKDKTAGRPRYWNPSYLVVRRAGSSKES